MSFGFGVGDFIAVADIVSTLRKDFIAAPSEYKAVRDETTIFSSIIQDVRDIVSTYHVSSHQRDALVAAEQRCKDVLNELESYLNKNSELGSTSTSTSTSQAGLRVRTRRLLKRLKASSEETSSLLQRLANTTSMLTNLYSRLEL